MKGYFCILLIMSMIGVSACGGRKKSENTDPFDIDGAELITTIEFVSTEHDFGQVREGEQVVATYEVKNTGKVDLLIHNIRVSCGCTSPKFDNRPIRPGRSSTIEVTFDTRGRVSVHRRSVVFIANTDPSNTNLYIIGEVVPNN